MWVSKSKWRKTWKLKFKSMINSVDLNQYGSTHKIINQDTIFVSKVWNFKVNWLKQLSWYQDIDFTTAKIIKRPSWYYIHLILFVPKENGIKKDYKWDHL